MVYLQIVIQAAILASEMTLDIQPVCLRLAVKVGDRSYKLTPDEATRSKGGVRLTMKEYMELSMGEGETSSGVISVYASLKGHARRFLGSARFTYTATEGEDIQSMTLGIQPVGGEEEEGNAVSHPPGRRSGTSSSFLTLALGTSPTALGGGVKARLPRSPAFHPDSRSMGRALVWGNPKPCSSSSRSHRSRSRSHSRSRSRNRDVLLAWTEHEHEHEHEGENGDKNEQEKEKEKEKEKEEEIDGGGVEGDGEARGHVTEQPGGDPHKPYKPCEPEPDNVKGKGKEDCSWRSEVWRGEGVAANGFPQTPQSIAQLHPELAAVWTDAVTPDASTPGRLCSLHPELSVVWTDALRSGVPGVVVGPWLFHTPSPPRGMGRKTGWLHDGPLGPPAIKAPPMWARSLVDSCEDDEDNEDGGDGGEVKGVSGNKEWTRGDMRRGVRVHMRGGGASRGIDLDIYTAMAEMDFPGTSSSYGHQEQDEEEEEGDDDDDDADDEDDDDGDDGDGGGVMSELSDPDERAVVVGVHATVARRAMRDPELADLSWPDEEEPRPMPSPHPQYGAGCAEVLHAWRRSSPSHLLFRHLSTTVSELSPSQSPGLSRCHA